MLISANGVMTRTPVTEDNPKQGITIQGRSTQGVRVMTLNPGDQVACITVIDGAVEEEAMQQAAAAAAPEETPAPEVVEEKPKKTTRKRKSEDK